MPLWNILTSNYIEPTAHNILFGGAVNSKEGNSNLNNMTWKKTYIYYGYLYIYVFIKKKLNAHNLTQNRFDNKKISLYSWPLSGGPSLIVIYTFIKLLITYIW